MDFALPELHRTLRDEAVRFAQKDIVPHAEHIDAEGRVPDRLLRATGELGLFGLLASEAAGGVGLDPLAYVLVTRALAEGSPSLARLFSVHAGPATMGLEQAGMLTDAHVSGTEIVSYSNGELAPSPDRLLVIGDSVYDDFGAEAVDTLGHRGARLAQLTPGGAAIGTLTTSVQPIGDLGFAAIALGSGFSALRTAVAYAKERRQFKRPIADFQAIQFKIADAETALQAAEGLVHRAACEGTLSASRCAAARYVASRAAREASDHAIQIHGGYGYTREYPVERHYRSARMCAEGADRQRALVYAAV